MRLDVPGDGVVRNFDVRMRALEAIVGLDGATEVQT
jgi:hypothetical protein